MRLELKGLAKSYSDLVAVDGLDLQVGDGEIVGLLGRNGAGKTTTLKMIVGLAGPDSGSIRVDGVDRVRNPTEARRRIGYLPDRPYLPPRLTGREYLYYFAGLHDLPASAVADRIDAHILRFHLAEVADRVVDTYSHGMKQKVALGNLFVHDPPLLIVDEPMVGLDVQAQALVKESLREEAARGKGILLTTHTLTVAEALCDRIAILDRGRLRTVGTPDEIVAASDRPGDPLEDVFLSLMAEADA